MVDLDNTTWKRSSVEALVSFTTRFGKKGVVRPLHPSSIFVLRNNDIGDLLTITSLFQALKTRFPSSRILAGVGRWNLPVLANNPFIDEIIEINAPWHNNFVCPVPHRTLGGLIRSLRYLLQSSEVHALASRRCDIGIDVLGSPEGALLMRRAGIPWRIGVKGYAGGHTGCNETTVFDAAMGVGRAALRFAEILGACELPDPRPQLFLSEQEKHLATITWNGLCGTQSNLKRIVVAPGGGNPAKCWPRENYRDLVKSLSKDSNNCLVVVGSDADRELGAFVKGTSERVIDLCGRTSLRETFALVWGSEGVICNSSMILHAAAAFARPTVVLLGDSFGSARKHKQLWGHGREDLHLGREADRNQIYDAEEAQPIIYSHLGLV